MGWAERRNRTKGGGMGDADLTKLANAITECTYSTQGCKRLPVRMVYEMTGKNAYGHAEVDLVLLCCDHAPTYQPHGKVLLDQVLSDGNVNFLAQHGV